MDANPGTIMGFIDQGGVVGVLVLAVCYLAVQNHRLTKRNEKLVDRHINLNTRQAELAATIHATLDKLAERIRGVS